MPKNLSRLPIYHITAISNLPSVIRQQGLLSDAALAHHEHEVIGYGSIKARRLLQYRVPCCGDCFVGQFVPFYYCPRSPMLYTVNRGNTGKPAGYQSQILHLVTTVQRAMDLGRPWAISDGNAGANHTSFYGEASAIDGLNWNAINATNWSGIQHEKQAEFLVRDFVPWTTIRMVGCMNSSAARQVQKLLEHEAHRPEVVVEPNWYYR